MDKDTIDRFFSKVDKTSNPNGCWEWLGGLDNNGYGLFRYPGKPYGKAHRFSAEFLGNLIISNLCVCHTCDNPKCVNPAHLWAGTAAQNIKDRDQKGRHQSYFKIASKLGQHTFGGKNKQSIQTPLGTFIQIQDAARAHGVSRTIIYKRLRLYPSEYFRL